MAKIVIDEWLWTDLSGSDLVAQKQAFEFIQAIFKTCDQIVTVKGSPFVAKAFLFCKQTDIKCHEIAKYYQLNFFLNSKKSFNLEQSSLPPLPEDISKVTNLDDHYLIQAYLAEQANVLVTTDNRLMHAVCEVSDDINCQHRDDFLPSYIEQHQR